MDADPVTLLPVFPVPRLLKWLRKPEFIKQSYYEKFLQRKNEGWHYGTFPDFTGTDGSFDFVASDSGDWDSHHLVLHDGGVLVYDGSFITIGALSDEADDMELRFDDQGDLEFWESGMRYYEQASVYVTLWRWWQFRLGESVFDCFNYRERVGAGNFNNH